MATAPEYVVDFPTLWVAIDWTEAHCVIPDRDAKGQPFVHYDWQLWFNVNWYRVKPTAQVGDLATAFHYRRAQLVGPQKYGKGPEAGALVVAQARGPVVFAGWAKGGEVYRCSEHGCDCGWEYVYPAGEPMGRPWATPLIQLTGTSDDAIDRNAYGYIKSMLRYGPLAPQVTVGEVFTRLPNDGMIETVTSSAMSRLGNPIIFALQDETGTYTDTNKLRKVAETQRRGAAGMGGRTIETTNTWDPSENSVAQRTHESRRPDIFKFWRNPDTEPSLRHSDGSAYRFTVARERRKILHWVYQGAAHIDLAGIEAEALELMEKDPGQAERFFGNRVVQGLGTWLPDGLWASREVEPRVGEVFAWSERAQPPDGTSVCLGFDGSDSDDWTGIRLRTVEGYRFTPTYGPDKRPTYWNPAEWGGSIPRAEVNAAVDEICARFKVKRAYCDPRDWQSEIGEWAIRYGDKVFLEWATYRPRQMHEALERVVNDLRSGRTTHDGCPITTLHVTNARKRAATVAGVIGGYMLGKPLGAYHQKIDMAMADVLAHIAGEDALLDGWATPAKTNYFYSA